MSHQVVRLAEHPELEDQIDELSAGAWPRFLNHDPICSAHWGLLFTRFAEYQAVFVEDGRVIAVGHTSPFVWDGSVEGLPSGVGDVLVRAVRVADEGRRLNTLSALAAIVAPEHQGRGLSGEVLRAMGEIAAEHGLSALVAPVRPKLKSAYPLTPMERYVQWRREDGIPFDPWIRVHWRLGAEGLAVAPRAMVVPGTVAEWEEWTGMAFPESGLYVVPGALVPVEIDRRSDQGLYEEPNYWMRHPVRA